MELLVFILACYGMTMIVVYGKIFQSIRPQHHFFHCPMCMGFWVGIFNWLLIPVSVNVLSAAFISSGTSYFLSRLVDDEGILVKVKSDKQH